VKHLQNQTDLIYGLAKKMQKAKYTSLFGHGTLLVHIVCSRCKGYHREWNLKTTFTDGRGKLWRACGLKSDAGNCPEILVSGDQLW
jgi:hypothetical protein